MAAPKPHDDCLPIIKAADKVIAAKDKEIKLSDLALKESRTEVDKLSKEVVEKDEKLGSIFRNPYVLIGIGLIGGALLFKK